MDRAPSPWKGKRLKWFRNRFLGLFTAYWIGVIAHDVASIYGLHVEGYHAIYYAIPLFIIGMVVWWRQEGKNPPSLGLVERRNWADLALITIVVIISALLAEALQ